jgi:hypothetical protein
MDEREYYAEGIGPIGYYADFSMSDMSSSDGGWSSSNTTNVGLTASSMRGDTLDYDLEVEPNNQINQATPITIPAKIMGDSATETANGMTTEVPLMITQVAEDEPNDSNTEPQRVNLQSHIVGDLMEGDGATSVSVQPAPGGPTYTTTFEDWYEITLGSATTLESTLDFPGTSADLDIYLFSMDGSNSVIIEDNSVDDNIATGVYSESLSEYLQAGTYYLAVDGYVTDAGRANYTLDISTSDSMIEICDWFSFTLPNQTEIYISIEGDSSFIVADATGSDVLFSGNGDSNSITLDAGSYLIGINDESAYTLEVSTQ